MAGALVLAGQGALYSGAGWVQLMMLDSENDALISNLPELMVHKATDWQPPHALQTIAPDVVAIGPGLGLSDDAKAWLEGCLNWNGPLILDADSLHLLALNTALLSVLKNRKTPTCLTPHPGEAARLLGITSQDLQLNRQKNLEKLVKLTHAHVVLKGHRSLLAAPKHDVMECPAGNSGMAVAGMGDVLTGCIAAIVAQGMNRQLDVWQSINLAVHLHALAGDSLLEQGLGPIGMTPSELAKEIRSVINQAM
jgi:ADP-dependent NAD(P)H-hydrate dehydratase / NAD(P)H-hydrate epimerase